jgi:glycosyltransferase involved in cell wall biosynthesis
MDKKIKITYIMPSLARGGAERFLIDLLSSLNRQRFEPSLILFKEKGVGYEELSLLNIPTIVLEKRSKIDLRNIWQIYKNLKEISPDIVHTQLGGDIRGRLAAKLAKIKIIISTEQNINHNEDLGRRLAKIITSFWTKAIVAITPAVATDMKKRYLLNDSKCQIIIPNGLPLNKFPYQEERPQGLEIIVGAVGRLNKQKGFDNLITAWHQLRPEKTKLLIAGSGPEEKYLKQQIKKTGLETKISLLGDVADMPSFYQSLNLFIMPSRWEGQGIAALEAGASGVPVLASASDGLAEIIQTDTAWVCAKDQVENLATTLKDALSNLNSEEAKKRQRNLRDLIVRNFSITKSTEAYSQLYEKLWQKNYENITSK